MPAPRRDRPGMSRCRRPRPPMSAPPARPGPASARCGPPLPAARGLSGAEQTGRKPGRKASCLCVCTRGCASPECVSVCARVRVRVCALPPPSPPPPSRSLPFVRASSPSRRRRLSGQSRAGPGFINMLIVLVVGGESRVKVTRESAALAATCVRRAARGRSAPGNGMHVTQLLKNETEAETPARAGAGEREEAKPHARRPSSGCAGLGAWRSGSGDGGGGAWVGSEVYPLHPREEGWGADPCLCSSRRP